MQAGQVMTSCSRVKRRHSSQEQVLYREVQQLRCGLVFKAYRPLYRSTLGLRVITKRRRRVENPANFYWLYEFP